MRISELFNLNEWGLVIPGVNTTPDVGVDAIRRQAAKFGNTVGRAGDAPLVSKDSFRRKKTGMAKPPKLVGTRSLFANGSMTMAEDRAPPGG